MRNISRNKISKFIAFILVVLLIASSMVQLLYIAYTGINPESIIVKKYKDSQTKFAYEFNYAIQQAYEIISNFPRVPDNIEFLYYIKTDGIETTNSKTYTKEFFSSHKDAFYAYENGTITIGKNTNPSILEWNPYPKFDDLIMYIAFPDDYMQEQQRIWEAGRDKILPLAISITSSLLVSLVLIIYLIAVTGRNPDDDELHFSRFDNVYSEFLILAYIPTIALWCYVMSRLSYYSRYYNTLSLSSTQIYNFIITGLVTAFVTIISGILLLSIVRKIKGKILIKHSLSYKILYTINDFIKSLFDGRRFGVNPLTKTLHKRQVIFIVVSFILVFLTFLFIMVPPFMVIPPILEVVLIYWYVKYNNETYEEINKGFNESLEEQMKSERMKIELITNVSHDLKTPLTSIISYVDLLSKEEDLSETARDYVNILVEKSNRLKNIVSDLFDLAKSTSGDINLDFENIDMKKLIEQTLGDMEDNIVNSGLQIKTYLPDSPLFIRSDGKKLYRVFQNIIDNALKYSLQGTRVFVELEEKDGKAIATIKNISGYEMDFTAEEILQRFNRGDKSRTTDGSGLGLSIAESFTKVCGGKFKIDIDGDMFKVMISFDLV